MRPWREGGTDEGMADLRIGLCESDQMTMAVFGPGIAAQIGPDHLETGCAIARQKKGPGIAGGPSEAGRVA